MKKNIYLILIVFLSLLSHSQDNAKISKHYENNGNVRLLENGVAIDYELVLDEDDVLMGVRCEIINTNPDKKITMVLYGSKLPFQIMLFGDGKSYKAKDYKEFPITFANPPDPEDIVSIRYQSIYPRTSQCWYIPMPDVEIDLEKGDYESRNFFIGINPFFDYALQKTDETTMPEHIETGTYSYSPIEDIKLTKKSFSRDVVSAYIKSKTKNCLKAKEEVNEKNDSSEPVKSQTR